MLPDVTELLNVASVQAFVGTNPARIYKHGSAPARVLAPYITWFLVAGTPDVVLDGPPPVDNCSIQANIWSENTGDAIDQADQLAEAARSEIVAAGHVVTSFGNDGLDHDTQRNRISLIFTIWNDR